MAIHMPHERKDCGWFLQEPADRELSLKDPQIKV